MSLNDDELLESIDRHFMVGCISLNARQLKSHEQSGICSECIVQSQRATAAAPQVIGYIALPER